MEDENVTLSWSLTPSEGSTRNEGGTMDHESER